MKINALILALLVGLPGLASAKLPAPTEEQKAKQEETKAKTAEANAKANEQLATAQDKVAARWIQNQKARGITVMPTPIAPPPAPAAAAPAK